MSFAAPRSTYRLQLEPGRLDLAGAERIVGYLADLGISHVYLSPILEAVPGSTHGYDVADPTRVREALGGEQALRALAATGHRAGLGLVVDIVPNHLGVSPATPLWEALLRDGRAGEAASFFDVDWDHRLPGARGKVVLPVLGAPYGDVLDAGELDVVAEDAGLRLRYFDHSFPLTPASAEAVTAAGGPASLRGQVGDAASWDRLHAVIEQQHYRLVWWRAGGRLINYRRFFTIDELAGLRVEQREVFDHTHATILRLVDEGLVDGLRVDHPDGLRDPRRYFERLVERTGGAWTVAEKITEHHEDLPEGWPVAGTTGYEFANEVLGLFVDPEARPTLDAVAGRFEAGPEPYAVTADRAKHEVVTGELAADVGRVARHLWVAAQSSRQARDVAEEDCREVVARLLRALTVYRTYVDPQTGTSSPQDRAEIDAAVVAASGRLPAGDEPRAAGLLYRFAGDVLAGRRPDVPGHLDVLARFQQLSGAVMAKGIEDTALYRHRRLLAVNEVGGDPERLGSSVEAFHDRNVRRAVRCPTAMLTTATHDTKRGEDVRLRIAALSELTETWEAATRRLRAVAAEHVSGTVHGPAPDPPTELLIYQTLVGVWPLDGTVTEALAERVGEYAVKACREGGQRTTWEDPDAAFEAGVADFVAGVLGSQRCLALLGPVAHRAGETAIVSGLAQTLLRVTCPGVPDTYQGTELWEDSLVDPDNRRPVDFDRRARLLRDLARTDPAELLETRRDGRVKLWVLARALAARVDFPDAYGAGGGYVPLAVEGQAAEHVVAFARRGPDGARGPVTVAVRLPGRLLAAAEALPLGPAWGDTRLVVPPELDGGWEDRLSGAHHSGDRLTLSQVLTTLPVALLAPV